MSLIIEKQRTGSTPYILIDSEKKYMKFEGECYHENVISFFGDISVWLDEYLNSDFDCLTFDCELRYFNSSTAKLLLNMLMEMDDHAIGGKKVVVNWITTKDNNIITECGEDFGEEMNHLEFNLILREI